MDFKKSLKKMRLSSEYFKRRKGKMYYLGRPERINFGKYLITSEETPFMILPLIKYSKDTDSALFFLEGGAYPQKIAFDFLISKLKLKINSYSYKITRWKNPLKPFNKELGEIIIGYIKECYPSIKSQKITIDDVNNLNKVWRMINKQKRDKITKKFPEVSNGFEKFVGINKLKLLFKIIESEPIYILDTVKKSLIKNRADSKGSINYRAKYNKRTINLKEKDFGKKYSEYRERIFNYLMDKFPGGINKINERYFYHEFNNFHRDYLNECFCDLSLITLPLIRYITKSMNIRLGNVIYCDDAISTGFSFFVAKFFHTLIGDGEFRFNIYTHMNDRISLGETQITEYNDFYEDIPEMFDFYYSNGKKIKYKFSRVNNRERETYNYFINWLRLSLYKFPKLKKILKEADKKVYLNAKDLTNKTERYFSMLFFLIQQSFLNEECLRLFGHHSLVNYLEDVFSKRKNLEIDKILNKLKIKFKKIKAIRKKMCMNILLREHKKYLKKIKKFENFFDLYQTEINNYIDSAPIKSDILTNSKDFVYLTKLFYKCIDSLNYGLKEIPFGY